MKFFAPVLLLLTLLVVFHSPADSVASPSPIAPVAAQPVADDGAVEVRSEFRGALVKAIRAAVADGELNRRDALKLRVASFSPAFQQRAKELCVVQMVFSGENADAIPMNADGTIDETAIDWEGLTEFLKVILPILLELLLSLGIGA